MICQLKSIHTRAFSQYFVLELREGSSLFKQLMKTIRKRYQIGATLAEVLDALTSKDQITTWSGSKALMECHNGGKFSLWEGAIYGVNRTISESQIVQDWKESSWEHYSTVTINLKIANGDTILDLVHQGVPDRSFHSMRVGWDQYYLGPLKEYLEKQQSIKK